MIATILEIGSGKPDFDLPLRQFMLVCLLATVGLIFLLELMIQTKGKDDLTATNNLKRIVLCYRITLLILIAVSELWVGGAAGKLYTYHKLHLPLLTKVVFCLSSFGFFTLIALLLVIASYLPHFKPTSDRKLTSYFGVLLCFLAIGFMLMLPLSLLLPLM